MKKLMALVLSLGLVLLGTAPVMAAGQALNQVPLQTAEKASLRGSDKAISWLAAEGEELGDASLEEIRGENPFLIAFAIGVAAGVVGDIIYDKLIKPRFFPKPKPKPVKCKCNCSCEATCPAN